jgi:XTP/dITP diphosphohydrolase
MSLLLERLGDTANRQARFVSTLVAVRHAGDPEPLIAFGRWELEVLREPRGSGGFGYDPLMLGPTHGCSVAELPAAVKNGISHRALVARQNGRVDARGVARWVIPGARIRPPRRSGF